MQHLQELNSLIDSAAGQSGSDYALAKTLGVSRQAISNWRHGHKGCPPEDQALMAAVAGLDPVPVLARAMVQKHEGTPKGDRLMRALGKSLLATGGVLATAGANAAAIFSSTTTPGQVVDWVRMALDTMYIMLNGAGGPKFIAACAC